MKAVIVELLGTQAAALTSDGSFLKIKNRSYAIGQTIELKTQKRNARILLRIAAAAAAAAVIGIPAYAYYTPYSYVSLDVNPSIEFSLNRFDRVLSYDAVGSDGQEVLKRLSLKNKNIQEAIELTLGTIVDEGYLTAGEPGGIVIAAFCVDPVKSGDLAATLANTAETAVREEALDVEIEAESVGQDRVQEAKELGVTPGKLNLIEKLQQSAEAGEEISTQDWLDKSVKEIMEQTKENKKSEDQASGKGNANSAGKDNSSSQKQDKEPFKEQDHNQRQKQRQSDKQSGN